MKKDKPNCAHAAAMVQDIASVCIDHARANCQKLVIIGVDHNGLAWAFGSGEIRSDNEDPLSMARANVLTILDLLSRMPHCADVLADMLKDPKP